MTFNLLSFGFFKIVLKMKIYANKIHSVGFGFRTKSIPFQYETVFTRSRLCFTALYILLLFIIIFSFYNFSRILPCFVFTLLLLLTLHIYSSSFIFSF